MASLTQISVSSVGQSVNNSNKEPIRIFKYLCDIRALNTDQDQTNIDLTASDNSPIAYVLDV